MGMMGAAIDFGRWHNANSKTEAALDAALLAAGRQLQTDPSNYEAAIQAANTYFNNLTSTRLTVENAAASFNMADNNMAIEGKATGIIKTPFLALATVSELDVFADAKAELAIGGNGGESNLEISIMLDVTESMCDGGIGPCTGGTKMDAMKFAAKDLIKIIMGGNNGTQKARVALVPFSTRVRVAEEKSAQASTLMKTLTNLDPTWSGWRADCLDWSGSGTTAASSETDATGNWTCNQWQTTQVNNWKILPCVTERTGPEEFTDTVPQANAWLNAHQGNRTPISWDSSDSPMMKETGLTQDDPYPGWNYSDTGECWDINQPNYVVPLTSDETVLAQRVDALEAYGATAGALGTAWAWYMISPDWANVWGSSSTPGPYSDLTSGGASGAPKLRKIAVLMTDGEYNTYRGLKNQDPNLMSNNAITICNNMKAKGIEVFTVGFDLNSLSATSATQAKDTLKACGTDVSHFYDSLDASQLKNAFRDIAMKLTTLYIAK